MSAIGTPGSPTYSETLSGLGGMLDVLVDNSSNQITARNVRDVVYTLYQGSTKPYLVFTALLTQSGTASPTIVECENTIGSIGSSYTVPGNYLLTSSGLFVGKVGLSISGMSNSWIVYSDSSNIVIQTDEDGDLSNTMVEIRLYP